MFERLEKYFSENHIEDILSRYDESWRYFHTRKHLEYILSKISMYGAKLSDKDIDILYLTTLFHDAVYLPWSKTNEEDSAQLFKEYWNDYSLIQDNDILFKVYDFIIESKAHNDNIFNYFDMYIVNNEKDPSVLLEWEEGIFKEFSFVPYSIYRTERIKFLNTWIDKNDSLLFLRNYVESRQPKVGFYAGSFNPFHKGHLSIVNQGKEIYDKVVILIGQNASKAPISDEEAERRKQDVFKKTGVEVKFFNGLLPQYIQCRCSINNEIGFLIRGIRNEEDFKNEEVQARYMKTIWDDLKIVYLTCPNELNFISSSGIKAMNAASAGSGDIFIPNDMF